MSNRVYGWIPSPPDFRDHIYEPPPARVSGPLPRKTNNRGKAKGSPWFPIWEQGRLGSCGPHTACRDIVFAGLVQQSLPSLRMPSRLFVYWTARREMGRSNLLQDSGVTNRDMLSALHKYGWCEEDLLPYSDVNTGSAADPFRREPSQACFDQAAGRKIVEYLSVPQDLETMKTCLAGGDPFIFGFSVYQSFESPEVERTGIVPMPGAREKKLGGHDVLVIDYDDDLQAFLFVNSYGADWGQQGLGAIPYAYATNPRLASDFWTVRHAALAPVPPLPPVPPLVRKRTIEVTGEILVDGKVV